MDKKYIRASEDLPTSIDPKQGSFVIYDWMVVCLGLSLLPLLVFALIFSVTVGGDGSWYGSNSTMAARLGVTRRSLIPVLRKLVDTGMIIKDESPSGHAHRYTVSREILTWYKDVVKNVHKGCEECSHLPGNVIHTPCEDSSHNTEAIRAQIDNTSNIGSTPLNVSGDEEEDLSANSSAKLEQLHSIKLNCARDAKERNNCAQKKERAKKASLARPRFVPPTIDEVAAYCGERGNSIDPHKFVDYYTANGWMVGRNSMKDWQAVIRNWERNEAGWKNGHIPVQISTADSDVPSKPTYVTYENLRNNETSNT